MQWLTRILQKLPPPLPALAERFDKSPLITFASLAHFVQTRSAYTAQTSMYGYLKTRMGTSFRVIFEDKTFAEAIHAATVKLYGSCLCDLAIHCAARVSDNPDESTQMALQLFDRGISCGLSSQSQRLIEEGARDKLILRLQSLNWPYAAESLNAFTWSRQDIVRFAPVIDQYKHLDGTIVSDSIKFRWITIAEQARARLVPQSLLHDWSETHREGSGR